MTIEELQREFYDDLHGLILEVRFAANGLRVLFQCDDWHCTNRKLLTTIQCDGLAECTITPSSTGLLRVTNDHPLLWAHNVQHQELYFSTPPENSYELSGRLHETLARLFGRFGPPLPIVHTSAEILAGGFGLLARGPRPAIEALRSVAERYIKCSSIAGHTPEGGFKLLEFDGCYVVCRSIAIVNAQETVALGRSTIEADDLSDIKRQAEALRIGLLAGYVVPAEVIAWAESVIEAGDVPGPELIDVSLGGGLPVDDLARALNALPGEVFTTSLSRTILRQMAAALRRDPATARGIAQSLYQMWLDGLVPSPEARAMSRLDDAFALAESGTWGTLHEVYAELAEFLSEWAE